MTMSDESIQDLLLKSQMMGALVRGASIFPTDMPAVLMLDDEPFKDIDKWMIPRLKLALLLTSEISKQILFVAQTIEENEIREELDYEAVIQAAALYGMHRGQQLQRMGIRIDAQ
jgi:hypothetical protein